MLRTVVFVRHDIVAVFLYVFHFQLTFFLIKLNKCLYYNHIAMFIRESVSSNSNLRERIARSSRFSRRLGWEFQPSATWHYWKVQTVEDEGIIFLLNFGNRLSLDAIPYSKQRILILTYFYESLYEQTTTHTCGRLKLKKINNRHMRSGSESSVIYCIW